MEQEMASAMHYIVKWAGDPAVYMNEAPQDFLLPAVYFPQPEVKGAGDTLHAFAQGITWYVKFFHTDTPKCYEMAARAAWNLQRARGLVPLMDKDGKPAGGAIRICDPMIRVLEPGVVQLTLEWRSRVAYGRPDYMLARRFFLHIHGKNGGD